MDDRQIAPKNLMSMSKIMTIVIYFYLSHHREFKWYYLHYICGTMREYFPKILSYNRFVEVMKAVTAPLILSLVKYSLGKCSGISFMDSTTLDVCDNRRISSHKVFDGLAKRGKSSTGWFYGFKLHLAINDRGEIIAFCLTPGNVDDRDWCVILRCSENFSPTEAIFLPICLRNYGTTAFSSSQSSRTT